MELPHMQLCTRSRQDSKPCKGLVTCQIPLVAQLLVPKPGLVAYKKTQMLALQCLIVLQHLSSKV